MLGIVDACIIVLLLMFAVVGLKRGVFKQAVITIGTLVVFILAYYTKDYLANFLSYNLPFFNFGGDFLGLTTLNIILYQLIAFLVMFSLFSAILVVLIKITGVFEKILKMTIILGIPSKILGFILGAIEGYIVIFVVLFFLNQPAINIDILNESKAMPVIVNSSPGLSKIVSKTEKTIIEVYDLGKDYIKDKDSDKFNRNSIDIMLKNKVITVEYVEKLKEKGKINISSLDEILNKYR